MHDYMVSENCIVQRQTGPLTEMLNKTIFLLDEASTHFNSGKLELVDDNIRTIKTFGEDLTSKYIIPHAYYGLSPQIVVAIVVLDTLSDDMSERKPTLEALFGWKKYTQDMLKMFETLDFVGMKSLNVDELHQKCMENISSHIV